MQLKGPDLQIEDVISRRFLRSNFWSALDRPDLEPKVRESTSSPEYSDELAAIDFSIHSRKNQDSTPPPWAIGFSKSFKKDTSALDRKMMGRILEILEQLSEYPLPFSSQGDTFKPLVNELDGCWRYRIGDYRLIIRPVENLARLDALRFAARGSVYD